MFADHRNLYSTAKIIIDSHGERAQAFAEKVVADMMQQDNLDVIAVWEGILKAIIELQHNSSQVH